MISTPGSHQTQDGAAQGGPTRHGAGQDGTGQDGTAPAAEDGTAEDRDGRAAHRRRRVAVLLAVALVAYLVDLGSKLLVVSGLEGHAPIRVIGDVLTFQVIRNPGAAFGMGQALTIVFTLIAASVIVVIWRIARKLHSLPWAVALGLLLGGALGNLTDRLFRGPAVFRGHVVDFVSLQHFAVFNLADSAIVCGGVLVVLLSFRGSNPDGTVHRDRDDRGDRDAAEEPAGAAEEGRQG
ncbi:signal peptidase II [Streptacidiphilus sp. ASG 303]|uniref:signal peptidase II n=1 Tax=Streptacidiphilus sp. ASG 303 TaxID=2896847 RepID=UPI001E5E6204|nr:signal peptidase II [Streptacidiphilus sp. ASG 303]MCD0481619.1 signal peptidase II [Streptacidiphilus sp. ASG 303]